MYWLRVYFTSTSHPLVRFPIFLMGMLAGLQVLRAHKDKEIFEDPNISKNLLHTLLPWGFGCCTKQEEKTTQRLSTERRTKIWRKRVDFNAFLYVGFLLFLAIAKIPLDLHNSAVEKLKQENKNEGNGIFFLVKSILSYTSN